MNHLDETTLNLYLDDALDANARAQADTHLAACDICQRELKSLRALTATFEAWRAEPIPRDVSAPVVARIATRSAWRARTSVAVLGVQTLIAAAVLLWVLPTFLRSVNLPSYPLPVLDVSRLGALNDVFALPLPPIALWVWILVICGGALVWFFINRLLFRSLAHTPEVSQ